MLRRKQRLVLGEEKPSRMAMVRTIAFAAIVLALVLVVAGLVVFACVHGINI